MISTRGRYAIRVLTDLAGQEENTYTPLKEITERQNISQKYGESIMTALSKAGMVDSVHGKGGGYRLNRKPSEYSIGEILRLTENSMAPVSCLENGASPCDKQGECRTYPMWNKLNTMMNEYLDSVSLEDLMD